MFKFRRSGLLVIVVAAALAAPLLAQTVPLDALMRGGRIHFEGQRFERAREQFRKALDQYGATADNVAMAQIYMWLGLSEAQLKNFGAASEDFITAMEKDTMTASRIRANEVWQYHASLSLLTSTRENYFASSYEPALRYALGAVKIDPSKPSVYSLIANIYSQLGRFEDMRSTANDMLKLDAKSAEAFGLLGLYFLQKPDSLWPTAAARLARWDSSAYYYDQAVLIYTDRFAKAKTDLGQIVKQSDPVKLDALAWQLIERSRIGQAELKAYIETDMKAAKQVVEIAGVAARLHAAATFINSANSRAGSAMLSASAQAGDSSMERFRAKAETYFNKAVEYDSSDYTSLFDLGIALYQGKRDLDAERALELVTIGASVRLAEFPADWQDSLVALLAGDARKAGYVELTGPLAAAVDSIAYSLRKRGMGYTWFYFPDNRDKTGAPAPADRATMFVSIERPKLLEQAYLWLGSSQTGIATTLGEASKKDEARAKYLEAVENLWMAIKLDPQNADAYQNLGICYRELKENQKALDAFQKADKIRKGK